MTSDHLGEFPGEAIYERSRQQFEYFEPHLKNPVFMENAGGSQVSARPQLLSPGQDNGAVSCVPVLQPCISPACNATCWCFPPVCRAGPLIDMPCCLQVPRVVVQGVSNHLLHNNAQLMAGYSVSDRATQTIDDAHDTVKVKSQSPVGCACSYQSYSTSL